MPLSSQDGSVEPLDPAQYWHNRFQYALAGLSWAVGALGENAGYAGKVHERLTNPSTTFPATSATWRRVEQ